MRILLTRPELRGEATAAALRARGHDVLHVPLLRIKAITDADLGNGPWSAVAMTSANAAVAIAMHQRKHELQNLPTFVVGARTKESAQQSGFGNVQASDDGVDALARFMIEKIPHREKILYLAGEDRAGDLARALLDAGHAVSTVVVYHAVAQTTLPDAISCAVTAGSIDAALHFSRRSAATFLGLAQAASCLVNILKYKHFCLSAQVAEPFMAAGAKDVIVAARPNEAALLELVGDR